MNPILNLLVKEKKRKKIAKLLNFENNLYCIVINLEYYTTAAI